jgi:undecaprenyl-diphosphatase
LVVGLALAARGGPLPGDERLSHAWAGSNNAFVLINVVATVQIWTLLVLLAGAGLWVLGQRYVAALLVVADLAGEALSFVVKALVLRPRPTDAPLADALATASFPSGHVMRVAVALGIIVAFFAWPRTRWRWPCAVIATGLVLAVGVARIASGEHWPSDVLASAILAAAWLEIIQLAASRA